MNIFELLKDKYVLPKEPRLFEAFSGIGCQRMAFERLGIPYKSVGISEIDKYAIKSYQAMHQDCNNYGSICDIKGSQLPQIDVFTWSFPCTDLSKAGRQKGLQDGTRSGLVYEVLRILQECKLNGNLPKVLIMENVVDLVQAKFVREFQQIQLEIEQLGYSNYTETLNAKDYGVAQNRDRVFMVSILGDYYYEFPKPIKLEKRLKDYLETDVDPKYYLSDRMLKYCTDMTNRNGFIRGERFNPQDESAEYAFAITTNPGSRPVDNFIKIPEATIKGYTEAYDGDGVYINRPHQKRGVVQDGMIQTLKTTCNSDIGVVVIGNYSPSNHDASRIVDNKGLAPTVKENHGTITATQDLKKEYCNKLLEENLVKDGDMIRHSYTNNRLEDMGRKENENGISATLTTRPDTLGIVVYDDYNQKIREDQNTIGTLTTNCGSSAERNGFKIMEFNETDYDFDDDEFETDYYFDDDEFKDPKYYFEMTDEEKEHYNSSELAIRKLTPRECWRLMGIDDAYFDKAYEVNSNAQLYKQAGNGIVVDVFAAIIGMMKG